MSIPYDAKRRLRLCTDFEYAMPVIAYYIKLSLVEELLALEDRNTEVVTHATRLLDEIEAFKQGMDPEKPEKQLLEDQQRAKVYCMNFVLSLYNEQLAKVQSGSTGGDLARALWCCSDLFGVVLALWGQTQLTAEEAAQCQKRTKVCKLYLSKLARGELNAPGKGEDETSVDAREQEYDDQDETNDINDGNEELKEDAGLQDIPEPAMDAFLKSLEEDSTLEPEVELPEEPNVPDIKHEQDTDELIRKMREIDANDAETAAGASEEGDVDDSAEASAVTDTDSQDPELALPSAPTELNRPVFVDEPPSSGPEAPDSVKQKPVHYNRHDLQTMWNREDQISQVQKTARFAISALNYEDITTARLELTKALKLLEEIDE
ncbi:LADA_0H01684g1_1 [Lachancea dasiensis]|uniref:LADA_0H01684g1_1 n=1 Tax=Lachancea dasiensis TaxID=1072105 RepID=A0A1G4JZE2_9SACH|nr:LADA_0H01684g1_1 [Lachancea dasiensis]